MQPDIKLTTWVIITYLKSRHCSIVLELIKLEILLKFFWYHFRCFLGNGWAQMNSERCKNWLLSAELSNFDAALSNFAALMRVFRGTIHVKCTQPWALFLRMYNAGVSFALFLPAFLRTYNAGLSFAFNSIHLFSVVRTLYHTVYHSISWQCSVYLEVWLLYHRII
jgi:hypothetical protein